MTHTFKLSRRTARLRAASLATFVLLAGACADSAGPDQTIAKALTGNVPKPRTLTGTAKNRAPRSGTSPNST